MFCLSCGILEGRLHFSLLLTRRIRDNEGNYGDGEFLLMRKRCSWRCPGRCWLALAASCTESCDDSSFLALKLGALSLFTCIIACFDSHAFVVLLRGLACSCWHSKCAHRVDDAVFVRSGGWRDDAEMSTSFRLQWDSTTVLAQHGLGNGRILVIRGEHIWQKDVTLMVQ